MFDPSSFANPTPLAHADTSRDVLPREQRQNQEPTDFVYDLLKLNKKSELGMSEKALVDHISVRLEPQVQDKVEVRNPQTAIQLLGVLAKFEERYLCKATSGGSKIILDFDRKSLAIPDSLINKVVKTVELEKVEIGLSKTKLEERLKRELQNLVNSFQGLFSDKPGLTHVLYHEIDTGDNPPFVFWPYRYDRVKQEILDYHVDKMLKEGPIIPIQSPYASPVVLCRKNNGLHHHRIMPKPIDLLLIIGN
ncbi:retrovirus-related Pol polyprotein from transposon 17.6 [Trichonephila clavipes]|uniref:Retrovirus-related Pol polyprotein from transposon 17.6 n=1 Tax=Trichonephila clavipes TaxID=2585209 RepID=A0A8X6REY0_TRICX|nr:retrovirus-related Pol polyprotein from transposon 17.6 [Trichonephila clavipes]